MGDERLYSPDQSQGSAFYTAVYPDNPTIDRIVDYDFSYDLVEGVNYSLIFRFLWFIGTVMLVFLSRVTALGSRNILLSTVISLLVAFIISGIFVILLFVVLLVIENLDEYPRRRRAITKRIMQGRESTAQWKSQIELALQEVSRIDDETGEVKDQICELESEIRRLGKHHTVEDDIMDI
jgi:hypothetical protein